MPLNEDEAREFLARVMPWPENQLEEGFCSLHWTKPWRSDPAKIAWDSRATRSPDELTGTLRWVSGLADTRDIYVCLSRQRDAEQKTSKSGRTYRVAQRSSNGAIGLKALFLDLDFKQYPAPADAGAALKAFGKNIGLPDPSVVVMTGGGLHVYWTIDRLLAPHEWLPLAHGLSAAAQAHGLKCDTACTVDISRILRVPGTLNHKYDPLRWARLVHCAPFDYTVDRFALLLPFSAGLPIHATNVVAFPLPSRPPLTTPSDLAAGIEPLPLLPVRELLHECGFLRDTFVSGGVANANPLWHLSVLASTWLENGRGMAHAFSEKHGTYTHEETEALFERKVSERKARNLGYPSCTAIRQAGSVHCATCPHLAKGKSPLNLATRTPIAALAATTLVATNFLAPLPNGYERSAAGCIVRLTLDEDGQSVRKPVSSVPILNGRLVTQPERAIILTCRLDGGEKDLEVPATVIKTPEMRKLLQRGGYMESDLGETAEFLMAWANTLQNVKEAVLNPQSFGWVHERGQPPAFAFGGTLWSAGPPRTAAPPGKALAKDYTPIGEASVWMDAAALVTSQQRPELNAVLASAFAGPLIAFTGQDGLCMAVYSRESGIGKTTAMRVAQAVWGHPVTGMNGLNDTGNSVDTKLAALSSLPLYWDELKTSTETKDFLQNLVFRLTSGKKKGRLDRNSQLMETESWNSLLVSAANSSIVAPAVRHATTAAVFMRIFEFPVAPGLQGQISPSAAAHIVRQLDHNHGMVGLAYAQFLGANASQVKKDIAAAQRWVETQVGTTRTESHERYWVALCAALIKGAEYGNALSVVDIDVPKLASFLLQAFRASRLQLAAQSVDLDQAINISDLLLDYLTEVRERNQVLVTNYVYRGPGVPPKPIKSLEENNFRRTAPLAWNIQLGDEDQVMLFRQTNFENWCHKREYAHHDILDALKKHHAVEFINGRLGTKLSIGAGLDKSFQGPEGKLLRVDLNKLGLAGAVQVSDAP